MKKSNESETNVVALSSALDSFNIYDMVKIPIAELREKCSFLIGTEKENIKVGVTFVQPHGEAGYTMEVAVVRTDYRGANRVPLNVVAAEFGVLQVYATVGLVARRFTQALLDWGAFKQAISELAGDVGEQQE